MIGRRLIGTLTRQPASSLWQIPFQPPPVPWPQRGLRRPCGCDTDVRVFGHVCCTDAPPDPLEAR